LTYVQRVRLNLPDEVVWIDKEPWADMQHGVKHSPEVQGLYLAYQGRTGDVVCGAGNGGAYVRFDGETGYVGCPVKYLEAA
jgi:hypothetical protein